MPSDLLSLLSSILAPSTGAKGTPAPAEGQGAAFAGLLKGLTAPVATAAEAPQTADTPAVPAAATPVVTSRPLAERVRDLTSPFVIEAETPESVLSTPAAVTATQKTSLPVRVEDPAAPVAAPPADTQDIVAAKSASKAETAIPASPARVEMVDEADAPAAALAIPPAQAPVIQTVATPQTTDTQPASETVQVAPPTPVVETPQAEAAIAPSPMIPNVMMPQTVTAVAAADTAKVAKATRVVEDEVAAEASPVTAPTQPAPALPEIVKVVQAAPSTGMPQSPAVKAMPPAVAPAQAAGVAPQAIRVAQAVPVADASHVPAVKAAAPLPADPVDMARVTPAQVPASETAAKVADTHPNVDASRREAPAKATFFQAPHLLVAGVASAPEKTTRLPKAEPAEDAGQTAAASIIAPATPMTPMTPEPQAAAVQASPSAAPATQPSTQAETPSVAPPAQAVKPVGADAAPLPPPAVLQPAATPDAEPVMAPNITPPPGLAPANSAAAPPMPVKTGNAEATTQPVARKAMKPSAFTLTSFDAASAPAAKVEAPLSATTAIRPAARPETPADTLADDATTAPQASARPELQTPAPSSPAPADSPALAPAMTAAATTAAATPPQPSTPETPAPVLSQVATDTLAALSVSVAKRLNDGATKFSLELHPADFGKVEVSLIVGKDGKVAAHLSFDSAATATAFHARESELRQQLAQAGLDVAGDALSFSTRDEAQPKPDTPANSTTAQNNPGQNNPAAPFDGQRDAHSQARANSRRAAKALADSASAAEDTDLDSHLARLRRPVSRLALDLTV